MKDWNQYAQSRAGTKAGDGAGSAPRVSEYFLIKLADNWIAATVIVVAILFAVGGVVCAGWDKQSVSEVSKWFFDAAKLCLGVFLGLITSSKGK